MSPTPRIDPRPTSGRLQAASERIRARRRRSERTLWLVASLFCVVGLGATYAAYVDAQPKQAALPPPPTDTVDRPPVIEISHQWNARERRWTNHRQDLRRAGEADYAQETQQRAADLLRQARATIVELAMSGRDGPAIRKHGSELDRIETQWAAFLKGLPPRRTFLR